MFKRASVSRTGAVRVERDLNLRKTRASHHRRNVDDDDRVFPAGQNAWHKTVRRDERVAAV